MRRFIRNTKGAVTVFVTLLLIPAVLVSGTAVDLARIHTARSALQDANQLAANSVLTQYNALLYDIYGLFGVAKDDPILGKLLDDYIKVSVFGESFQDRGLGTLQLLYGADISLEGPVFDEDMNLENDAVLRRQIEEYMKFRGPVIIVEELLNALDNNSLKADKEVIDDKMEIDARIAELSEKYKELYNAITKADKYNIVQVGVSRAYFGNVTGHIKSIRLLFADLYLCYAAWESAVQSDVPDDPDDPDAAAKAEERENTIKDNVAHYNAILENIRAFIVGGKHGLNWSNGKWRSNPDTTPLTSIIEKSKQEADEYKKDFDVVVRIARDIDAMHDDLERKIDELERKLESGECSEELKKGLTEKNGTPPMSLIERYRDILKWDNVTAMSTVYKDGGYDYIDNIFKPMLDEVEYRYSGNPAAGHLSLEELANLPSDARFRLSQSVPASSCMALVFARFPETAVRYPIPDGFIKFAEHPGDNKAFYDALARMVNQPVLDPVKLYDEQEDAEGGDTKEKQENIINNLLKLIDTVYTGLTNDPLGAKEIYDEQTPDPERLNLLEIVKLITQTFGDNVFKVMTDPLGVMKGAANHVLLLTYATSMFSNYTTTRPDSIGKKLEDMKESDFPKTITGVPISPKINYFFQSEWEYLYHGSENAGENLSAVTKLLFLVRLICDYITVFSVSEVTGIVSGIQAAFAWCPPIGVVLGELARAAFAAAEALVDVAMLRTGHKVPLMKSVAKNEWVCSPSGIAQAIAKISVDQTAKSGGGGNADNNERGLLYSHYMLFFFIAKGIINISGEKSATAELGTRIGNLIEWNMINLESGANANEAKMAEALNKEGRFKLSDMNTGFSLSTTVDLRMLFLSMPFARQGAGGVIPPQTMRITETCLRGY